MLKHPTYDQLNQLGLHGMAAAFADLATDSEGDTLSHHEWLGLLLDHEATLRQDKRFAMRLRHAKLRHSAAPEDIDYRSPRGLDKRLMETLLKGGWIGAHDNLLITGPTGVGKSWLACAIGTRRAATAARSGMCGSPRCSASWRSRAAMVASRHA